jgi:hypothetical protein
MPRLFLNPVCAMLIRAGIFKSPRLLRLNVPLLRLGVLELLAVDAVALEPGRTLEAGFVAEDGDEP